ncbi:MAG TPA: hypothetical protein VLT82_16225 [Myxococcaceae bacterium]|nr:hypothetical protein [Myxococcaceae bacterium]
MGIELTRLFVPLGLAELAQVVASNGLALPERIGDDHLTVCLAYPQAMALGRHLATAPGPDGVSFLLKVEVVRTYLQRLEPRVVGSGNAVELWLPASELAAFNRRIARPIRLLHALYGPGYAARALPGHTLFGDDIRLFLAILEQAPALAPAAVPRPRTTLEARRKRVREMERLWAPEPLRTELKRALAARRQEELQEALRDEWERAAGLRGGLDSRPEGWDERLLRAARPWLLGNLPFWRVTGAVPRGRLLALAERLHRRFPHPAPTLRGTLLD